MRIGVLSDVHGNLPAFEAVRADMVRRGVDRVINLGDISFRGPFPQECLRVAREMDAPMLIGNTEAWLTGEDHGPFPAVREWIRARLSEEELGYLAALPFELRLEVGGRRLLFVHGSPRSHSEFLFPHSANAQLEEALMGCEADIVICGHSHWTFSRRVGDLLLVGVGSVGLPFDWDSRASYALLDITDGQVALTHVRLDYDREETLRAGREREFPDMAFLNAVVRRGARPE